MPPKVTSTPRAAASSARKAPANATSASAGDGASTVVVTTGPLVQLKRKRVDKPGRIRSRIKRSRMNQLPTDAGHMSVNAFLLNETSASKPITGGGFEQRVVLYAQNPFQTVTTTMLSEGNYKGYEAIIIKPSFNIFQISLEARNLIYRYYLSPDGNLDDNIEITSTADGLHAKHLIVGHEGGSKEEHVSNLLRSWKEVADEVRRMLYMSATFYRANTLLAFLCAEGAGVRNQLVKLEVGGLDKDAQDVMRMLAHCKKIESLKIEAGVGINLTPAKAAKKFWKQSFPFLEAMAEHHGDINAGISMLELGDQCLFLEKKGKLRYYTEDEAEEFFAALEAKMQ